MGETLQQVQHEEPVSLAAFRATYSLSTNVVIVGPYSGKLDNSSDDVELKKPTIPVAGEAPYGLVDKVDYRDSTPWPGGPCWTMS